MNASTSHLTSWLAFSNVKLICDGDWAFYGKATLISLISTTEPQTQRTREPWACGRMALHYAAPRSSYMDIQEGALCSLLTWGSTSIHVSAISKACFQQIPGRVTQGRLSNEGDFASWTQTADVPRSRGLDAISLINEWAVYLQKEFCKHFPTKEYTGRVLIKPSTLKCLRNFPKTQLEIWHNQSIILILIF